MKEITAILILLTLLTSCGEQRKTAENTVDETSGITAETSTTGEISCEVTTTCSDTISPITTTSEIADISPKNTKSQATVTVSENAERKRPDDSEETAKSAQTTVEIPEAQPKTESQATVTVSENAEEKSPDDSEETAESARTTAKIPETQPKTESQATVTVSENAKEKEPVDSATTAVQTEVSFTESPDIPQKTDYEKALEIYNFMRENGSGTCVNYACQTYEMCQNIGLPCYIVWTNAVMYGHVANTVKISDIWYILDTQGGYFLDYNYGFTEVVDIDGNHVADGDILSNYSYNKLN